MEEGGLGRVLEHVATCRQCLDPDSVLNALEEECKALEIRADRAEELLTGGEQMEVGVVGSKFISVRWF